MADTHAETVATVEHPATGGGVHAAPTAFGLTAPMFIGFAAAELLGLIAFAVAMIILYAR